MNPHKHPLTLSIVVKAETPEQARQFATSRMNEWFNDPTIAEMIDGYGCQNGSLMLWRIVDEKGKGEDVGPAISSKRFGAEPYEHESDE